MSSVLTLLKQTQLAEVAYADLNGIAGLSNTQPLRGRLTASGISDAQANAFVAEWEVIDHVPDTAFGFSATIFRNRQSGDYALSVRGTRATSAADILNDINVIAGDGLAVAQLVDLYNFWQRANTASGADYIAARAVGRLNAGGGTVTYTINWIPSSQLTDVSLRQGTGAMLITPAVLNVTGHSLGAVPKGTGVDFFSAMTIH